MNLKKYEGEALHNLINIAIRHPRGIAQASQRLAARRTKSATRCTPVQQGPGSTCWIRRTKTTLRRPTACTETHSQRHAESRLHLMRTRLGRVGGSGRCLTLSMPTSLVIAASPTAAPITTTTPLTTSAVRCHQCLPLCTVQQRRFQMDRRFQQYGRQFSMLIQARSATAQHARHHISNTIATPRVTLEKKYDSSAVK